MTQAAAAVQPDDGDLWTWSVAMLRLASASVAIGLSLGAGGIAAQGMTPQQLLQLQQMQQMQQGQMPPTGVLSDTVVPAAPGASADPNAPLGPPIQVQQIQQQQQEMMQAQMRRVMGEASSFKVTVDGNEREFVVHRPGVIQPGTKLPIVMALHATAVEPRQMIVGFGYQHWVSNGSVIMVYPKAINTVWSMDGQPTYRGDMSPTHDDIAFLDTVIDMVLEKEPAADPEQLFLVGASRGGMMVQYYLPRSKHTFMAAGSVIGAMTNQIADSFKPTTPTSFMFMLGDQDHIMPWDGTSQGEEKFQLIPAEEAARVVVGAAGIRAGEPDGLMTFGNRVAADNCTNEVRFWFDDDRPADDVTAQDTLQPPAVGLVRLRGGGHFLPGGYGCRDFHHAQIMLNFFGEVRQALTGQEQFANATVIADVIEGDETLDDDFTPDAGQVQGTPEATSAGSGAAGG